MDKQVRFSDPLLQQLSEGRINFHQLVVQRVKQLNQSCSALIGRVDTQLRIQTLMDFHRGTRTWANFDDHTTTKQIAVVLRFDPQQLDDAHHLGLTAKSHVAGRLTPPLSLEIPKPPVNRQQATQAPERPKVTQTTSAPVRLSSQSGDVAVRQPGPRQTAPNKSEPKPSRPPRITPAQADQKQQLAQQIKDVRQQLGWSQVDVGRHTNVSGYTACVVEQGKTSLTTARRILQELQHALGQSLAKPAKVPQALAKPKVRRTLLDPPDLLDPLKLQSWLNHPANRSQLAQLKGRIAVQIDDLELSIQISPLTSAATNAAD